MIRLAGPADVDAVAARIADAFHPLAVSAWLVAEPTRRRRVLAEVFRITVAHAVTAGRVWTVGACDAAAVWLPQPQPGGMPAGPPDYDRRLAAATGACLPRFRTLDRAFAAHHPTRPHEHLVFLAVAPAQQRCGLGSALLTWAHRSLDRTGTPGYLEATSTAARRLYLSHGYRDHGSPMDLPDGPRLWPMWREPHRTDAVRPDPDTGEHRPGARTGGPGRR